MEVAAVVAMEVSPAAFEVIHPRYRWDSSRLAKVVGPRRAPPSLLVPHSGYGPPLPLHPTLLLLHFRFRLKIASPYSPFQSIGAQAESLVLCGGDGAPPLRLIRLDVTPPRP
ncbi:hypothetical protein VPH35_129333 [Triticum aestivum]